MISLAHIWPHHTLFSWLRGFLELWSIHLLSLHSWVLHASNISTMWTTLTISAVHWRYACSTFCCSCSSLYVSWQMNLGRHLHRQFSNRKIFNCTFSQVSFLSFEFAFRYVGSYTLDTFSNVPVQTLRFAQCWSCTLLSEPLSQCFSLHQTSLFISLLPMYCFLLL